ncbi:MAG TPA: prohibitin family protein [Deltaproteobacteria bacterium]|nr:prohibitin family protein [Deltaproteobacteria bacterium]HOI06687.1 prohibitin family protein [Deltaproteobacteria bacterium]
MEGIHEIKVKKSMTAKLIVGVIAVFFLLSVANPIVMIPAGHVGVQDLFGNVLSTTLKPGLRIVIPFTKVVKMSVQTQEYMEVADTPSKEGLIINLDVSLLYRLDPEKAADIYKTVGTGYKEIVVEPQLRSAVREVTASYEAKALYSAERERVAGEIKNLYSKITKDRGIITDQILLRKIGLPNTLAMAIQEKLKREQESEQMKFVLQKEQQEAERKRIEAQGISDFQRIVSQGITPQILEWKGIEATEKLANSQNTKIVVIGNPKNGLPLILGGEK